MSSSVICRLVESLHELVSSQEEEKHSAIVHLIRAGVWISALPSDRRCSAEEVLRPLSKEILDFLAAVQRQRRGVFVEEQKPSAPSLRVFRSDGSGGGTRLVD